VKLLHHRDLPETGTLVASVFEIDIGARRLRCERKKRSLSARAELQAQYRSLAESRQGALARHVSPPHPALP
jgi:hypothetical protein